MDDLLIKAFSIQAKKLLCPICSADAPLQSMCAYGDYPTTLFCPHCDLTITFSHPDCGCKSGHTYWHERCVKKFIEEYQIE